MRYTTVLLLFVALLAGMLVAVGQSGMAAGEDAGGQEKAPAAWPGAEDAAYYRFLSKWALNWNLYNSAERGPITYVRAQLAAGATPNHPIREGNTALHAAARGGKPAIIELLIKAGADTTVRNKFRNTPLHEAAQSNQPRAVVALLAAGADINARDAFGYSPAMVALLHRSREALKELETAGSNVLEELKVCLEQKETFDYRLGKGVPPLFGAAFCDRTDLLKLLAENGTSLSMPDKRGRKALHHAAEGNAANAIELLIAAGEPHSAPDPKGTTPLHLAAQTNSAAAIVALIAAGADSNALDKDKHTPMHIAVKADAVAALEALVTAGVAVDVRDTEGRTALHLAVESSKTDTVAALLRLGANANAVANDGHTPATLLATKDRNDIASARPWRTDNLVQLTEKKLQPLVEGGADLALTGPQGLTPALTAVANGFPVAAHMFLPQGETLLNQLRNFLENNPQPIAQQRRLLNSLLAGFCCLPEPEAVKLLCAAGAFARFAPDGDGRLTPVISWAVQAGQKDVVATLLELGADARQFNKDMNTPLHFAAAAGSVEIARMLLDAGAAVNDRNKEWQTPLHNACREHEFEMIEELLSRGADANTVGKEMETPLHLLVWRSPCHEHEGVRRFTKALECLLEHGEDINAQDIEGNTPLNLVAGWVQFPQDEDAITVAAKLMLENGASVAAANKDGLTPCHTASMMNCPLIARMLITRGADINARDNEGRTPLCWVFKFVMVLAHFADTVDTLIGAGGDIESRDNDGLTILDRAARETYHFIVPYLISKGASPTSVGPDGKTALHHASLGGQDQAAEALLNAGADIALRDGQLMTPVLYALAAGSKEVLAILDPDATRRYSDLEYLIANNGNLDAKAMAGRQMIHGAARLGDVKAIEILLQAGVGVYEMPDYGRPALFHACETNATVAVEALIKAGADVNLECSGVTPLHSAVSAWSLESIQILIKAGADKTAKDNNRKTAFDLAKDLPPDIRELLKP